MPNRLREQDFIAFASEMSAPQASSCIKGPLQEFAVPSYKQSIISVRSLPPESSIVGLMTPSCGDDGAVQFCSPVICEEEATQLDHWPPIMTASENDLFDHEKAELKGERDFHKVKKGLVHKPIWQKKSKKKLKKGRKNKKRGNFGSQRTKTPGKKTDTPTKVSKKSEQPVTRQVNYTVCSSQPGIHQPSGAGDGSDGSDQENGEQRDFFSGHYAGIAEEEGEEDENEDVQNEILSQRLPEFRKEVSTKDLIGAREVKRLIVHVAHKPECSSSSCKEESCDPVRSVVRHFMITSNCGCAYCHMVELAMFLHAIECDLPVCSVQHCKFWKNWLRYRRGRRHTSGRVIHSTTTLFKENSPVSEDVDYAFLQKFHLGRGAFGDAWRVWLYSPTKHCEADIVVKEARYDLKAEAEIHKKIRLDHPNLLGAMAIIKFDSPRKILVEENKMKYIHGYVLMERAECTLYERKEQFRLCGKGIPVRDIFYYIYQICEGLRYLHDKEIVHKDVKDKNVLMFHDGQVVKLSDWDAAIFVPREFERERTAEIPLKGTAGFCAPEVFNKECHGYPADIYSTGAMAVELLYGGVYLQTRDESIQSCCGRRQAGLEKLKKDHPELGRLMEQCLAENPQARPTARELVTNDLLKFDQDFKVTPGEGQPSQCARKEFRFLPDAGVDVQQKLDEIKKLPPEDVLEMMDRLDKVLPSENLPQSSSWVGQVQEESLVLPMEATETDEDDHENDGPINMSIG